MSLPHAHSGEVVSLFPQDEKLKSTSTALLRTERLEVMRLVLHADKPFPEHHVDGESTIQCLQGEVTLQAHGREQLMRVGDLSYLGAGVRHALWASGEACVLVTLLRNQPGAQDDEGPG